MEMDTALAVAESEDSGVDDLELIALTPSDLLAAQTNLINWCDKKIATIRAEATDLRENLKIAKESKWRTTGLSAAVNRSEKRIVFYEKIKAAVGAGYLIVPNFPVDVFAVRVKRQAPKHAEMANRWRGIAATAEQLPAGEGRYVSGDLVTRDESYEKKTSDGHTQQITSIVADSFNEEIGFPVLAVKPVILDATHRAMALRIFDQIGMVANGGREYVNRKGDPIVVGRLLDPKGNGRMVTFFIAWWLNTNTL